LPGFTRVYAFREPFSPAIACLLPDLLAFFYHQTVVLEMTKTVILSCPADRTHPVGSLGNSKRLAMKSHRMWNEYLVSLAEVTGHDDGT
jgi:hypothetical protein